MLTQVTRRLVVDETGPLVSSMWTSRPCPNEPVRTHGGAAPPALAMSDRPSLMTAIQEDLGLTLETRRREVEVLVVDRVERPTDN